jgi:UDP-glucose 4-epimerase
VRSPKHILVTGGAGFVGSHLVERLLAEGHRVLVIDDLSTGRLSNLDRVIRDPRFDFIQSKVSQCRELSERVKQSGWIFHLAAAVGVELVVRSPIRTISTNLVETEVILETAGAHGVPVLITSTSEVYGKSQRDGFSEDDDLIIGPPRLARWSYACSKLMDEFLAMAYARERGLPVIVTRLFNTVGPRQTGRYGMVLPRFVEAATAGQPLRVYGDGNQTRCFCFVGDTVEALLRLQRSPQAIGEIVNVGTDDEISIRDLAALVIRTLRSRSEIASVPYDQAYAPGFEDMQRRRPVIEKCQRLTGFRPATPLVKIIELTAAGPLPVPA